MHSFIRQYRKRLLEALYFKHWRLIRMIRLHPTDVSLTNSWMMGHSEAITPSLKFVSFYSSSTTSFSAHVGILFADPATGVVTTKARLDRETKASYTLILVARDQGTPSQQATRRLNIIVKDIDDHPPQFIRPPVC